MKSLEDLIQEYLQLRRSLGFSLRSTERVLAQFAAYQRAHGHSGLEIADAVDWAVSAGESQNWHATRLSMVRQFAAWANTFDPSITVPPRRLLPRGADRAVPYIYTDEQVNALMEQALVIYQPKVGLTYQTLIGLLACTGMRIGEAIRANIGDLNNGVLRIDDTKFGKSRLVPLHSSTLEALGAYRAIIQSMHGKDLATEALLVSAAGKRLHDSTVHQMFRRVRTKAGILSRSNRCGPRLHDLRHTFATNTLHDAYRAGQDPKQVLPALATYLGHAEPANTYWYLEATPELLGEAAKRLPALQRNEKGGRDD